MIGQVFKWFAYARILDFNTCFLCIKVIMHPLPRPSPSILLWCIAFIDFFFNLFFYWWIIALQIFVVFCQTSTWISHRYTYIPYLLNLPPHSTCLGWYRAPVWVSWAIQQIPTGYLFNVWQCKFLEKQWHPTPVLLPGKSHGWRSLMGYSPWGCKELDTTEH